MTIRNWLNSNISQDCPRLDCLVLLSFCLKKDKSWILSHDDKILNNKEKTRLSQMVKRRKLGEPIAYIINKKEFYGYDYHVDGSVLIPRPESEEFIEHLKLLHPVKGQRLIDIGTGSGALAITVKKHFPFLNVMASDISVNALNVAQKNAISLNADIKFIQSDLFRSIEDKFDYIFANLPYVPKSMRVSKEVNQEPTIAVFSGLDGLDCLQIFMPEAAKRLKPKGYLLTESLVSQHKSVARLAKDNGLDYIGYTGLVQVFKNL